MSLSSMRKDFKYIYLASVEKWQEMQMYYYVFQNQFSIERVKQLAEDTARRRRDIMLGYKFQLEHL